MNGYALGDALAGGLETNRWWQGEVTKMVAALWDRGIEVSRMVEHQARSNRHGSAAALLRRKRDNSNSGQQK